MLGAILANGATIKAATEAIGATFNGIGNLANSVREAITGEPSAARQAEALEKLNQLQASLNSAQIQVNAIEAAHSSIFVAGWRPAAGWTCVFGMAYNYIGRDMFIWAVNVASAIGGWNPITPPPQIDISMMITLLFGMLGLGAYRSFEKKIGVARDPGATEYVSNKPDN